VYASKEKAKVSGTNLSLGFPEFDPEIALRRRAGVEAAVARFEQWMSETDSPVRSVRREPARPGEFVPVPDSLAPTLAEVLRQRGIERLYVHQAESIRLAAEGKNIVVVTPTASGKTLCYNLPILNHLLQEPDARAMYLFPTKALAEDQLHEFQAMVDATGSGIRAFTYDGDTPQDARKAIRERASVVLTNPDMLHSGILPHHTRWAKVFENLRYVVIDELHYSRGVYGSHVANVVRRLSRICEFYGSSPQFICSTATIAPLPRYWAQMSARRSQAITAWYSAFSRPFPTYSFVATEKLVTCLPEASARISGSRVSRPVNRTLFIGPFPPGRPGASGARPLAWTAGRGGWWPTRVRNRCGPARGEP